MVHESMPESYTVLGLSNISFGLEKQARIVINSVFLYHAVKVGLDCAIVNAKEISTVRLSLKRYVLQKICI